MKAIRAQWNAEGKIPGRKAPCKSAVFPPSRAKNLNGISIRCVLAELVTNIQVPQATSQASGLLAQPWLHNGYYISRHHNDALNCTIITYITELESQQAQQDKEGKYPMVTMPYPPLVENSPTHQILGCETSKYLVEHGIWINILPSFFLRCGPLINEPPYHQRYTFTTVIIIVTRGCCLHLQC